MDDFSYPKGHIDFMHWLQANYPSLYIDAWQYIIADSANDTLPIIKEGLDDTVQKALQAAIVEYNRL